MTQLARWPALLVASTFNQLDQYASSPANGLLLCRTRCFYTSCGRKHHQYSLCLPMEKLLLLLLLLKMYLF